MARRRARTRTRLQRRRRNLKGRQCSESLTVERSLSRTAEARCSIPGPRPSTLRVTLRVTQAAAGCYRLRVTWAAAGCYRLRVTWAAAGCYRLRVTQAAAGCYRLQVTQAAAGCYRLRVTQAAAGYRLRVTQAAAGCYRLRVTQAAGVRCSLKHEMIHSESPRRAPTLSRRGRPLAFETPSRRHPGPSPAATTERATQTRRAGRRPRDSRLRLTRTRTRPKARARATVHRPEHPVQRALPSCPPAPPNTHPIPGWNRVCAANLHSPPPPAFTRPANLQSVTP